jgi:hypothetical protein
MALVGTTQAVFSVAGRTVSVKQSAVFVASVLMLILIIIIIIIIAVSRKTGGEETSWEA